MEVSALIGAVVRAALQVAAGSAIADGVLDGETINIIVGAVTSLATVAWSIWQKKKAAKAK